jgi:heat shock protein HslJ
MSDAPSPPSSPETTSPSPGRGGRPIWRYVAGGAALVLLVALAVNVLGVGRTVGTATPAPGEAPFIKISEPGQGATLPVPESITVQGEAGGLFENNVVVQALDSQGKILAQQATTVKTTEIGGSGPWSVDLVIPVKPGTRGLLFAFSSSPVDGSIMASASVEVTYGEAAAAGSEVHIDQPQDGAVLDVAEPVTISGTGRGLFENNVVVEALDEGGNVLVRQPTTMTSADVGGPGVWSIDLTIPAEPGSMGTVHAFSTSPKDGSVNAEDSVPVQFGEAAASTPGAPPPSTEAGIEDLLWSLRSFGGQPPLGDEPVTLDLEGGNASGFSGCNTYNGPYTLSGRSISIGPLATTRRACSEPAGIMNQENQYLTELQQVEAYQLDSLGLQLFGSASPVTLSYDSIIMGTVGFEVLPEASQDWTLTVELQDVSKADSPASVLGQTVITDFSTVPVPFLIPFDPTKIDTRLTYGILARITDSGGQLLFINTQAYNVITRGNPSIVDVLVEPAG